VLLIAIKLREYSQISTTIALDLQQNLTNITIGNFSYNN